MPIASINILCDSGQKRKVEKAGYMKSFVYQECSLEWHNSIDNMRFNKKLQVICMLAYLLEKKIVYSFNLAALISAPMAEYLH